MKLCRIIVLAAVCICLSTTLSRADVVVLKGGQELKGDIVAEKHGKLYVDIGVTVVAVPMEEVFEYSYGEQAEVNEPQGEQQEGTSESESQESGESGQGRMYYTDELPQTTIEQCVAEVGEAVVKVSSPAGVGSGFFINEQGYLITNYHVIERETRIEVTVFRKTGAGFDKKAFKKVKIEAINPFVDLALLKVEELGDTNVTFVYLGDIDKARVGEQVFAIGNPLGLERTVTNGVISSTSRGFEGLIYLQTNADINPGNSGGPLFNLSGEVIGVTNMGYIFFGGLGFAIPVDYVRHFIDNREAFAYDKDNPNTGYRYIQPDGRRNKSRPTQLRIEDAE
ncbi:MAG: trypsin-like peptidase domain-containing protein [Sedimentisphaerales bacterium]|nr:trypsin-like peptidase domain-containing protein [Sedimentisphaerales bacterium]